jgi:hypothetical protein
LQLATTDMIGRDQYAKIGCLLIEELVINQRERKSDNRSVYFKKYSHGIVIITPGDESQAVIPLYHQIER